MAIPCIWLESSLITPSPTWVRRLILDQIDALLREAGSDKTKMLSATIWLADIRYYDEMNAVWDPWVPAGCAPARACVEARLAAPKFLVEIRVVAGR